MAVELAKVWAEIVPLLKDGISLIPVRDKQEGNRAAKTPYGTSWKEFQSRIATEGELYSAMEFHNTTAIAIVSGEVSGNLECIDIDTKYNPGIDATLLADIGKFYPQLFPRLRIHKTPSGGYHILYRIIGHIPDGNMKLAGRMKTEEEIARYIAGGQKKPHKSVNFLETRGEGGYFLCPPSLGYAVHQNMPIPLLTWEERCSLINLCKSYDEVVRIAPTPRPTQAQSNWYTSDPFEDYNLRCDPTELMESHGWNFHAENNKFIWYTRPGKTDGVSASFNLEKRVFMIFTSSTDLEPRGYNPATVFSEFLYGGDKKKAYRALVDAGYGKLKQNVEQSIIKRAVINGSASVPNNLSADAKRQFTQEQEKFQQDHPYGTFWILEEDKYTISREDFLSVARQIGFRHYNGTVVQINQRFIERITLIEFFDIMKEYIKEEEADVYTKICNAYEKFVQASGKFIAESRLDKFDDTDCIQDSADTCYKFYNNTAVRVTADSITPVPYDSIEGYIWSDKMLSRNFLPDAPVSNLYEVYLRNATGQENGMVKEHVRNVIGFLCHDFNSPATLYGIVMTEMVNDPKKGGGSGKNIFVNLLKNMIGVSTASGSMVKWDDKFFAVWDEKSRIYFIPDIPKRNNWEMLKSAIEDPYINKKYRGEFSVPIERAPKVVFNTNHSFEDNDGGLTRRLRVVEFTDYYTIHGGVDAVHGKLFPDGFTKEEWAGFDNTILQCIQLHLQKGGKIDRVDLSSAGWEKKFSNQYGEKTLEFFMDNIQAWCSSDYIEVSNFQRAYDEYVAGELKEKYKLSQRSLNGAIREFCERHKLNFNQSVPKRIPNIGIKRVHEFSGDISFLEEEMEEFPF